MPALRIQHCSAFLAACIMCGLLWCVAAQDRCSSVERYIIPDGRDYRGHVNVTVSGIVCQKWTSQFPQVHDDIAPNPSLGLGDDNYCRNPFGDSGVGCFTTDPTVRYERCSIGPPCTAASLPRTFSISPSDGAVVSSGTFIQMTCSPGPCDVYFTTDGSAPSVTSLQYQHAFPLYATATIRGVAIYSDGSVLYRSAVISVPQLQPTAYFFPSPGLYTTPIMISVLRLPAGVTALVLPPQTTTAFPYTGPFWLAVTGTVTVVANGSVALTGAYTFRLQSPLPPTVFPASGTFVGGVRILIYPAASVQQTLVSINGSTMTAVVNPTVTISQPGVTALTVRYVFLGGQTSQATWQYTVLTAAPPVCSPSPSVGVLFTATNISCTNPKGDPVTVLVNGAAAGVSPVLLSQPGMFNITALYQDDSGANVTSTSAYELRAVTIASPTVSPCGGIFLGPTLLLSACSAVDVTSPIAAYASNASIVAVGADPRGCNLLVTTSASASAVTAVQVAAFAQHRANPMLKDSLPTTCSYGIYANGTLSTPNVRITTSAAGVASAVVACLQATSPAATLQSAAIGPFQWLRVPGLPAPLVPVYQSMLLQCVAQSVPSSLAALEGSFSLITSYTVQSSSMSNVTVTLMGFAPLASAVKVVRSDFGCDDVGGLVQVAAALTAAVAQQTVAVLSFAMPLPSPGTYRVCAVTDGYAYGPSGPTWEVTYNTPTVSISPCGGVFASTATSATTNAFVVSTNAANGTRTSVNSGPWTSSPLLSLPMSTQSVVTAYNGYEQRTCTFRTAKDDTAPTNATYDLSIDTSAGVEVLLTATAGNISPVSKAKLAVFDSNCSSGVQLWSSQVLITGSVVVPDDALSSSIVTSRSVVCLVSGNTWVVAAVPSRIRLSPVAIRTFPCTDCSSGLCLRPNGTCACVAAATLDVTECPAAQATDDGSSWLSILRIILLLAYVAVLIVIWVVMRQGSK